jgi:RNA polymerase sigma-70 factor (ECF subfamily)
MSGIKRSGMEETSDAELVALARAGDQAAFATLVRRHARTAYRTALRLTGNGGDAEEVLQEAFLRVHRGLDGFRGHSKASTWIYSIVVNSALMHLRARRRRIVEVPIESFLPRFDDTGTYARLDLDYSCAARADEIIETKELAAVALNAVAELPELYRVPFVLRDLEGLDSDETAQLLGLDAATLRQRLHRARLMLRARLNQLVGAES